MANNETEAKTKPKTKPKTRPKTRPKTKPMTKPRANYPLSKRVGDFVFVSGTSSRRPDNSFAGVEVDEMGTTKLDIRAQTEAVFDTMGHSLAQH